MSEISIVLTAFKRARQLDNTLASIARQGFTGEVIVVEDGNDGVTEDVCARYGAKRIGMNREGAWRAPSEVLNTGLYAATGETLIIQNAECRHDGDVIAALTNDLAPMEARFASVTAMNEDGTVKCEYCSPSYRRPFFFCGSVRTSVIRELNGFDEDFTGYGYEDDEMRDRMERIGVTFTFTTAPVTHQWHEYAGGVPSSNETLYWQKRRDFEAGVIGVKRNVGKWWDKQ